MLVNWGLAPHVVTGLCKCLFISPICKSMRTVNLRE